MELLLGKPVADEIKNSLIEKISSFSRQIKLVILLNKEDESSLGYVKAIKKTAESLSIAIEVIEMDQDEEEYLKRIEMINNDSSIDACLITRPLNRNLNERKILSSLSYKKDVDGINPFSLGNLFMAKEDIIPNTANAVIKMLEYYNIDLQGKKVLIVGRSLSVGKPASILLMNRNATITVAHSKTQNLNSLLNQFDIIIAALGKAHYLDGALMKQGAIVIDAGIHYLPEGIFGDVKPSDNLKYISKVPGGVGPITNACLMENVVKCYLLNRE